MKMTIRGIDPDSDGEARMKLRAGHRGHEGTQLLAERLGGDQLLRAAGLHVRNVGAHAHLKYFGLAPLIDNAQEKLIPDPLPLQVIRRALHAEDTDGGSAKR